MQKLLKPLLAVKTKSGYSVFTAIVVTLFSTWVIFDATKAEVVIAADGDFQTIKTHTATVGELFDDLGIDVGQHDELSHGENTEIVDGMEIQFETAHKILLTIDGETEEYYTTAVTVGQFLQQEGLSFTEHDEISHNYIEVLKDDMEIEVDEAYQVVVNDGGDEVKVWTTGGTVKQLLQKNDISFNKNDKVKPSLDEMVKEDTKVSVVHVEKKKDKVTESIPFETKEEKDSSIKKGTTRTVSEGKEGKVIKTYEVTYENGKEVNREVVAEDVKSKSKDKVVKVGTKEVQNKVVSNSAGSSSKAPASGGKTLTMEATAYGPDCKGCSGISAYGLNLNQSPTPKVVAVDPNVIPLGSRVWVEGYGEAIAGDTGGAIKGNRIDVLVQSESYAASNWGRRTVQVKVLD